MKTKNKNSHPKKIEKITLLCGSTAVHMRAALFGDTGIDLLAEFNTLVEQTQTRLESLDSSDQGLFLELFKNAKLSKPRILDELLSQFKTLLTQFNILLLASHSAVKQDLESSVTDYPATFELARCLRRKFVLLLGPTNSGKTYTAMSALAKGSSGAYFAPLRLLALEGQEWLFEAGVKCNLLTGEERQTIEGAAHTSSTIEMLDATRLIETAVIDEVQLISDPDRGWAWTAAICGVPAKTVYLVGSEDCLPWVLPLLEYLDEDVEIRRFDRKSALRVTPAISSSLKDLRTGDALIAFTRKDVLYWRDQCKKNGFTCSVIYGSLSPEVRREQARLFQTEQTQVLIATDAVGMGLNLPIARVVFTTVEKFDGVERRMLRPWELAQIAGRAGRFGIKAEGEVTAFNSDDVRYITKCLASPMREHPKDSRVCVAPSLSHVHRLAQALDTTSLGQVLTFFKEKLIVEHPIFKTAHLEEVIRLAWRTDRYPGLDLATRFSYACAPLEQKSEEHMRNFDRWLQSHSKLKPIQAPDLPDWMILGGAERFLLEAEQLSKLYSVYCWLCFKFPDIFRQSALAAANRALLSKFIEKTLAQHNKRPKSEVLKKVRGATSIDFDLSLVI